MEHKFEKGQVVNFKRNAAVKKDEAIIVAQVIFPEHVSKSRSTLEMKPTYIIEHEIGWLPDSKRLELFELDPEKKYLFVSETELFEEGI